MRLIGYLFISFVYGPKLMTLTKDGNRFFIAFPEGKPIPIRLRNLFDDLAEKYQCE